MNYHREKTPDQIRRQTIPVKTQWPDLRFPGRHCRRRSVVRRLGSPSPGAGPALPGILCHICKNRIRAPFPFGPPQSASAVSAPIGCVTLCCAMVMPIMGSTLRSFGTAVPERCKPGAMGL